MPIPHQGWFELLFWVIAVALLTFFDRREPIQHRVWFYQAEAWLRRTAHQPRRVYGYLALYTLVLLLVLSAVAWPQPVAPEEFSLRLSADTFAHGRLLNPAHPLWTFFETLQVVVQPFYAAAYPPAPGMSMALGQVLTGSPVVGLWLTYIGAVLAVYWLLTLYLPPVPALAGGWLVASHGPFILNWGVGFWGGSVLMLGGALVLGAALQLYRRPRGRYVSLMAIGVLLLWTSRPFEGLIFSLIPLGVLLYVTQQVQNWHGFRPLLRWIPGFVLLGGAMLAQSAYNQTVTGDVFRRPRTFYDRQYEQARPLIVQSAKRELVYNRPEMKQFHKREAATFFYRRTLEGFWVGVFRKITTLPAFYLGLWFLVPFLLFLIGPKEVADRLIVWSLGLLFVANLLSAQEWPQQMAPATGALAVAVGRGMLRIWQTTGRWRVWAQRYVLAVVAGTLPLLLAGRIAQTLTSDWRSSRQRFANETYLTEQGGRHVVLVHYSPNHVPNREWVYNGADIDRQPVIWAVDKGPVQNRALMRYYPDRTFWGVRPDEKDWLLYRLRPGT